MIEVSLFIKLTLLFSFVFLISLILSYIKQPLIIGYILSGILAGNYFLGYTEFEEFLSLFSKLGIAFMLFIVGLQLKLKNLKEIGRQSLIIGFLQVLITTSLGFLITINIGFNYLESLYLAIALAFSSTIIIIKLIYDKNDIEKLYSKLAIGILIIQDLIAILFLIFLPTLQNHQLLSNGLAIEKLILSILLIFIIPYLSFRLLPHFENFLARSRDLLFIFSIFFLFFVASIFDLMTIGIEIGALVAGFSLANLKISQEISSRLKPIKDFFLIIFFTYLGINIFIPQLKDNLKYVLIIFLFVMIKPVILFSLAQLFKINKKTSFTLSLTSAQISEFSFILINLGKDLGHVNNDLLSIISLVGLSSIFISSYLIYHSEKIYELVFKKTLKVKSGLKTDHQLLANDYQILLIGCDRTGYSILINLEDLKNKILIIEYNYEKFKELLTKGYQVVYVDAEEVEFWESFNFNNIKLIISTISNFKTNLIILRHYKKNNPKGIFICNSYHFQDTVELYKEGADYVNMQHLLSGERISFLIKQCGFNLENYEAYKKEDFEKIENILSYLSKTN
jgi:Kef-type K+ transport system membrane component KefB